MMFLQYFCHSYFFKGKAVRNKSKSEDLPELYSLKLSGNKAEKHGKIDILYDAEY